MRTATYYSILNSSMLIACGLMQLAIVVNFI